MPLFETWAVQLARCSPDEIERLIAQREAVRKRFMAIIERGPGVRKRRSRCRPARRNGYGRVSPPFATWCRDFSDVAANRTEELQVLRSAGPPVRAAQPAVRPERYGQEQRDPGAAGPATVVRHGRSVARGCAGARRHPDRPWRRLGRVVRGRRGRSRGVRTAARRDAPSLGHRHSATRAPEIS